MEQTSVNWMRLEYNSDTAGLLWHWHTPFPVNRILVKAWLSFKNCKQDKSLKASVHNEFQPSPKLM